MSVIDEINQELRRLEVHGDNDPYTGLSASLEPTDDDVVTLYDHWDKGLFEAADLLDHLQTLESVSMGDMSKRDNIWTQIIHLEIKD